MHYAAAETAFDKLATEFPVESGDTSKASKAEEGKKAAQAEAAVPAISV